MSELRQCRKCGEVKPLELFNKNGYTKDGRRNTCKKCEVAAATAYVERNREKVRARYKLYREKNAEAMAKYHDYWRKTPAGKESQAKSVRAYNKKFPERTRANQELNQALRMGRVKRQPCWVCGAIAEAHHPAYDQPLDVVWLCRQHHVDAHYAAA